MLQKATAEGELTGMWSGTVPDGPNPENRRATFVKRKNGWKGRSATVDD